VLKIFRRDAEKAVIALRETLQNNEIKLFTITAHAMKSALANVGETKKAQMAAALEKAGLDGDMVYISANIDSFIKTLEELIEDIAARVETESEVDDTDVSEDTAYLKEQLEIIKTACDNFDNTTVYNALDRLKEKTWKKKTAVVLESIREHVYVSSDFEMAAECAQALLK
jgi:HPt (histidine-containing phosphotransfer) domain-containing protein